MPILYSALIGYGLGALSPSALLSKIKKTDLRNQGTQNLGASNTMLVIGRAWGILVMFFDILKGFFSVKIAQWLFPQFRTAMLVAGLSAVIGHVFPFYLGFKGGKGLASFGGFVLAYNPWIFLILLSFGLILMLLTNASVAMPMSAGALFPILAGIASHSLAEAAFCAAASLIIIVKHWSNIDKARSGKDIKIRSFFKNGLKEK